jgi:hypothetical protein
MKLGLIKSEQGSLKQEQGPRLDIFEGFLKKAKGVITMADALVQLSDKVSFSVREQAKNIHTKVDAIIKNFNMRL